MSRNGHALREDPAMAMVHMAAERDSGFWPTGVIMLVVIVVISGAIGIWRNSKIKKGRRT